MIAWFLFYLSIGAAIASAFVYLMNNPPEHDPEVEAARLALGSFPPVAIVSFVAIVFLWPALLIPGVRK